MSKTAFFRAFALVAVLAGLVGGGSGPLHAQQAGAQRELSLALEAAARGDTAAAIVAIDRALELNPRFAEAHYRRGLLFANLASAERFDFEDRLRAEAALTEALRLDPNNPLYLLSLGKLMLKQQMRVDAQRMLNRALLSAARADATTLAEIHYQLAVFRETQWLRFRDRHMLPFDRQYVDPNMAFNDARYVWELLDRSSYPGGEQGANARDAMLRHLRAALGSDPTHIGATLLYLAYQYDTEDLQQYMETARRFVRAVPAAPEAYLALGLGLYANREPDAAAGAFVYALELMSEPERREVESISRLMARTDATEYQQLSPEERAQREHRYWRETDPLYLSATNEFWLEYMSRMTYAEMRFRIPEYGQRGWDTEKGAIWVRYGRPPRVANFPPSTEMIGDHPGQLITVWAYAQHGPVFLFRQNPGFRRATFAGDFETYAERYAAQQPASFETPTLPILETIALQAVRFRGATGEMDVEIHASLPFDRIAEQPRSSSPVEIGLFVRDANAVELTRQTREIEPQVGPGASAMLESWRIGVPVGRTHMIGVEARDAVSWGAAVGRLRVPPRPFPAGQLSVSDILLAHEVESLVEQPERRFDFRVQPNPSRTFDPRSALAFYFEIYNLLPDSEQYASYELDLTVHIEEVQRRTTLSAAIGAIADRWGLSRAGTDAAQLRFERQARVQARDVLPEHFRVTLDGAPNGRYNVRLVVRDRNSGREAVAEQVFWVEEARQ